MLKKNSTERQRTDNFVLCAQCVCVYTFLCACIFMGSYGASLSCALEARASALTLAIPQNQSLSPPIWTQVEQGLDMASLPIHKEHDNKNINDNNRMSGNITILRFHPQYFDFNVYTISENNTPAKTLVQWLKKHDLVAAINASMYLPDGRTSTGHLRKKDHINNARIAQRFGAFFLSQPTHPAKDIVSVLLVDRDTENWEKKLTDYETVVQNYRLISSTGDILWSAGGRTHSIAAVGNDSSGRILFLHCAPPISAHDFARTLLQHPINIHIVMYVEGGVQAGLVLRQGDAVTFWGGSHPAEIFTGTVSVALPNIIGVTRKKGVRQQSVEEMVDK